MGITDVTIGKTKKKTKKNLRAIHLLQTDYVYHRPCFYTGLAKTS